MGEVLEFIATVDCIFKAKTHKQATRKSIECDENYRYPPNDFTFSPGRNRDNCKTDAERSGRNECPERELSFTVGFLSFFGIFRCYFLSDDTGDESLHEQKQINHERSKESGIIASCHPEHK